MPCVPGQSVVSKSPDETQTDATRRGSQSPAAGGCGQQELAPREQVETGDRTTERVVSAVATVPAAATAAATVPATAAAVPATPSAEACARTQRRLFVRFGNLSNAEQTIKVQIQNSQTISVTT